MRYVIIAGIITGLVLVAVLSAFAAFDGKCPQCITESKTSIVTVGVTSCTTIFCGFGWYDTAGNWNPPTNCNACTTKYTCSIGHSFTDEENAKVVQRKITAISGAQALQ